MILDCNSYLAFFLFDFLLYWSGDGVNCKGKVTHLYICLEIIGNMLILTTLSKSKALQTRSGGCWKNCSTDTQQDSLTNNCICIPQKYLMQLYIIIHKSKSILRVSGCIPVPMKVSKKLNIKKTSITSLYHLSFYWDLAPDWRAACTLLWKCVSNLSKEKNKFNFTFSLRREEMAKKKRVFTWLHICSKWYPGSCKFYNC